MAAKTRIYIVGEKVGGAPRLVRAAHPAQALNHVARSSYVVMLASQDDLIDAVKQGVTVETATADSLDLPFTAAAA